MFFRRERQQAAALDSLMSQTRDTMVCFDFRTPVDPGLPQDDINKLLRDCFVVDASVSFARYFGFADRSDVIGKDMMSLFGGDIPDWFVSYGQEVEDNDFANLERLVKIPIGNDVRTMRIQMQNIFADKRLVRQWITIRDVSAEERARLALEDNELLKLLAVETVGLQTFSIDYESRDQRREFTVLVDEKAMPDWLERIDERDRESVTSAFRDFYFGRSERLHSIFRTKTLEEGETWIESWAIAKSRDSQGFPQGIVGVLMDRSQSKALEAKLIAAQRLESLGVLAGGIAHDFNNLLFSVLGAVDLAKIQHPESVSTLKPAEEAGSQLAMLCDQLLTYAGRGATELSSIDLGEIILDFKDLMEMSLSGKAQLKFDLQQRCKVHGDPSQIRQILMNLISNAADAQRDESGVVTVSMKQVTFDETWRTEFHLAEELKPGEYVCLSVTDMGTGMSQTDLDHLFDPFYTTKFTGRGLGMAVVMGVVKGHGGAIGVESNLGKGTTVKVVLPFSRSSKEDDPENPAGQKPVLDLSVMVVDDDPAVLEMSRKLLLSIGVQAELVADGASALEMFAVDPNRFDVVLMDVTMPNMDGIATASQLLDLYPEANIVMCSGYSSQALPPNLASQVSFLQKPYRARQLADKLGEYSA